MNDVRLAVGFEVSRVNRLIAASLTRGTGELLAFSKNHEAPAKQVPLTPYRTHDLS